MKRAGVMLFLSDQFDFKPVNVARVQPKPQKQVMLQIQLLYHVTDSPGARGQAVREGSRNDSRVTKRLRPPASLVPHRWERCSSGFCLFVCFQCIKLRHQHVHVSANRETAVIFFPVQVISCYTFAPNSSVTNQVHEYSWLQRRPEKELLLGGYVASDSMEQEDA